MSKHHDAALDAIYDAFCAMDNQDEPLEDYPQAAINALFRAGYAVVPRELPYEVLGYAQRRGVFETGNPKHGWDHLLFLTMLSPTYELTDKAHAAIAKAEGGQDE